MSVELRDDIICLQAPSLPADAESLLNLLQGNPEPTLDLSASGHLHAAVLQVLLAFRPFILGEPDDPLFRDWLEPLLRQAR